MQAITPGKTFSYASINSFQEAGGKCEALEWTIKRLEAGISNRYSTDRTYRPEYLKWTIAAINSSDLKDAGKRTDDHFNFRYDGKYLLHAFPFREIDSRRYGCKLKVSNLIKHGIYPPEGDVLIEQLKIVLDQVIQKIEE